MNLKYDLDQKIDELAAKFNRANSPGCAIGILQHGELTYTKAFGWANLEHITPISADTVFDVGSMAKQFTGMAIALLEEAGQINISHEIKRYLPDLPEFSNRVTISDLLHHTSGIRNYTVLAYYMIGYHEGDAPTDEEVYDLLKRVKSLNFAPGERYEYSDSNFFLLAKIAEKASGESLAKYAQQNIFTPLGMNSTLFRDHHAQIIPNRAISYVRHPVAFKSPAAYRRPGNNSEAYHALTSNYEHVGAEGLFTTVNDLAKWGRNFTQNQLGKSDPGLIKRFLTAGKVRISEQIGYGYGINIGEHKGQAFFGHDGAIHGYTSTMHNFPEKDCAIICLSNQNDLAAWTIRNHIMDILFPPTQQNAPTQQMASNPPRPITPVPDKESQYLTGRYQNPETADIWEVSEQDGMLKIQVNKSWGFGLSYVKPNLFKRDRGEGEPLRFVQNDAKKTCWIMGTQDGQEFTFVPFLAENLPLDALQEYAGEYECSDLLTAFIVEARETGIWLKNKNRHFCSMDLLYQPTILDHFIAYDPHPWSSQIEFIRTNGQITAFIYRDYDGDGREIFQFIKK